MFDAWSFDLEILSLNAIIDDSRLLRNTVRKDSLYWLENVRVGSNDKAVNKKSKLF